MIVNVAVALLAVLTLTVGERDQKWADHGRRHVITGAYGVKLGEVVDEAQMLRNGFVRIPGPTIRPHSPHPSWRKQVGPFEISVEPNTVGEVPAIIGIWAKRVFAGEPKVSMAACLAARNETAAELRRRHRGLTFIDRHGSETLDQLVAEAATSNIVLSFLILAERTERDGDRVDSVGRELTVGCRLADDRQSTTLNIGHSVGLEERGRISLRSRN